MLKILVTGSSGRVGSAIACALKSLPIYAEIVGVDRVAGRYTDRVFDLRDTTKLAPLAANSDVICHCAALHAPHVGRHAETDFVEINVGVTQELLRHSRPDAHFVFTSSTSVYGHALVPTQVKRMRGKPGQSISEGASESADSGNTKAVWIDEAVIAEPRDIYDQTKLAAEELLRGSGRSAIVLRMSRCFPEPERDMALYRLYRGVDIRDVVSAHLLAIRARLKDGAAQEPSSAVYAQYVISGPTPFTKNDLQELYSSPWSCICRYYPDAIKEFSRRNWLPPSSIDRVYSSDLAQQQLAYRPKYGFTEMLSV